MGYYDIVPKKSCTLPTVKMKIHINSIITLVCFLTFEKLFSINDIILRQHTFLYFSLISTMKITKEEPIGLLPFSHNFANPHTTKHKTVPGSKILESFSGRYI